MVQPGFWDNQDQAKATIDESNRLKGWIDPWSSLDDRVSELTALVELLEEEEDADLEAEFTRGLASVEKDLEVLEVRTMLQGGDDHRDLHLSLRRQRQMCIRDSSWRNSRSKVPPKLLDLAIKLLELLKLLPIHPVSYTHLTLPTKA